MDSGVPHDKWNLVWFGCSLLGVGVLLPWNALISAVGYFSQMLCDGGTEDCDSKSTKFPFYMSIAYNIPSIPLLLLSTVFASRFSYKSRIVACFSGEFVVFVCICIIVGLPHISTNASFWLILLCTFLSGCCSALLFGAILSFTAIFPPHYTTAVMSGNGVAGIIAGLLRVITLASVKDPASAAAGKSSSLIFFGITTAIFAACIVAFIAMLKNAYTEYYLHTQGIVTDGEEESALLKEEETLQHPVSALAVQKKIWIPSVCVFLVFFISLSLFPGMTYSICKDPSSKFSQEWFGVILIGLFQVCDFIGRTLPRWTQFGLFNKKILPFPILARALFFVAFIYCIVPADKHLVSNWWPCIFMVIFAITNGVTGSISMMLGPTLVEEHERPTAGYLMSLYLNSGIFAGVLFALAVESLVDAPECPP